MINSTTDQLLYQLLRPELQDIFHPHDMSSQEQRVLTTRSQKFTSTYSGDFSEASETSLPYPVEATTIPRSDVDDESRSDVDEKDQNPSFYEESMIGNIMIDLAAILTNENATLVELPGIYEAALFSRIENMADLLEHDQVGVAGNDGNPSITEDHMSRIDGDQNNNDYTLLELKGRVTRNGHSDPTLQLSSNNGLMPDLETLLCTDDGKKAIDRPRQELQSEMVTNRNTSDTKLGRTFHEALEVQSPVASLKAELKAKIQRSRLLKGKEEIQITFDPCPNYQMTPEEEIKDAVRKQRNRDSADNSRRKRKAYSEQLKQKCGSLEQSNSALQLEIRRLQKTANTMTAYLETCAKSGIPHDPVYLRRVRR